MRRKARRPASRRRRRRARSVRFPRQKWRTSDVAGGREDQTSTLEEGGETRGHEQLGHEGRNRRRRTVCCAQEHGGGIWQADVHPDLYNKYDADNSGELDQAELASLITDLEMLKDLEPAEVPVIIEEYFKKADTNNDGKVCFDEFALFYMDVRDVKKAGTSHLAVKVPKKWRKDEDLTTLFVQHCSFGKGNKTLEEMDGAAFAKMCAAAGLLDEKLTNTTVDLIFTKSKEKGKRKLHYNEFLEALALVASHKGYEFDELVLIIVEAGAPKLAAKPVGGSTGTRKTSIPGMPSRSGPTKPSQPKKVGKVVKAPGAGLKPVPMQSAAGKNMTVREMFDEYDPDRSGDPRQNRVWKARRGAAADKGIEPHRRVQGDRRALSQVRCQG